MSYWSMLFVAVVVDMQAFLPLLFRLLLMLVLLLLSLL